MCVDDWVFIAADPQMHSRLMMAMEVDDLGTGSEVLEEWLKDKKVDDVVELLANAGVPVAKVPTIADAIEDPHVKARGTVIEYEHKTAGKIRLAGFPVKMEKTPAEYKLGAPSLGEHSAEILKEKLGYTDEQIEELRKSGTVVIYK
jgi:CoA:oxalate CoA-transferase